MIVKITKMHASYLLKLPFDPDLCSMAKFVLISMLWLPSALYILSYNERN